MSSSAHRSIADLIVAPLLVAGTLVYLIALPRNLNPSDEAIHLYEAQRLLAGQVMYRDVFEIITPGWMYLMAGLFWLFGSDLSTARIAMAVIHAATMVLIAVTCRRLGVRPALAWVAAFAYLPLGQAAWPIASQHWLSTFLCLLLLFVLVHGRRRSSRSAFPAGIVLGLLIGVQQQRGVIMAVGVATWLIVDAVLERRLSRPAGRPLWRRVFALAVGAAIVVLPLMLGLIRAAGFEAVWRALVVHPLVNYGGTTYCEWGHINVMTAAQGSFTFPRTLTYLPAVFVLMIPRLLRAAWQRNDAAIRVPLLLSTFTLFSMLSIAYFPDFIHIAFIAGVFIVAIAENLEWLGQWSFLPQMARHAGRFTVAAALIVLFALQLQRNYVRLQRSYPITRWTAFGRIDLATATEAGLYDRINALLEEVPSRELYCYPIMAHLYLMAAAHNPTRYGFFLASYNSPHQVQEVLRTLEAKRLPYIVAMPAFTPSQDPVIEYLLREYAPIGTGPIDSWIFRRKNLSARSSGADRAPREGNGRGARTGPHEGAAGGASASNICDTTRNVSWPRVSGGHLPRSMRISRLEESIAPLISLRKSPPVRRVRWPGSRSGAACGIHARARRCA